MKLPEPGTLFHARYRIHEVLGIGGFSRVYRATDPAAREVALKVLAPDDGGRYRPDTAARFRRELQIIGSLRDPHTVTMYEGGISSQGLMFIAFEFVPGDDLADLLEARGRLETAEAIHVLRQVLMSLREAHHAGLLHRDIKPANIRVYAYMGDPLCVKMLDFGIAKSSSHAEMPRITKTGELIGTPRYMSPEQLLDQPLTPASDIYSLGLVMIETVLGRAALGGNAWGDQLVRIRSGYVFGLPDIERIGPRVCDLLRRMTAPDPAQRLQSTDAVLSALDALNAPARGPAPVARDETPSPTFEKPKASPRRWLIFAVFTLAVGVIAGLAFRAASLHSTNSAPLAIAPPPVRSLPSTLTRTTSKRAPDRDAEPPATLGSVAPTGCGAPPPFSGAGVLSTLHVLSRTSWLTYIPGGYDTTREHALLILLHPDHIQAPAFLEQTGLSKIADQHGFVIIAPFDGEHSAWRSPAAIDLVHAAVEHTADQLCIDRSRVFAVGHNNGGYAIERLTCEPWITAAATTSYRPKKTSFRCAPRTSPETDEPAPKPYLGLSPLESGHMPVEGGPNCYGSVKVSLDEFEQMWRTRNGCEGPGETALVHQGSVCTTWSCDAPYMSCRLAGGHGWTGMPRRSLADWKNCDGEPPDFPFGETIWGFFESTVNPEEDPGSAAER